MRKSVPIAGMFVVMLLLFVGAETAAAAPHMKILAKGGQVHVYANWDAGSPLVGALVTVSDTAGDQLLRGKTDAEGKFSFKPPIFDDLLIEVHAPQGVVIRHTLYCRNKRPNPEITAEQQACLDEIAKACALIEKGKKKVGRAKVFLDAQMEQEGRALCDQGKAALAAAKARSAWCATKAEAGCDQSDD